MNKERRKETANCTKELERIEMILRKENDRDVYDSYKDVIESVRDDLEMLMSDEEFAFDSIPENLQYSERGEFMQECVDNYSDAIDSLDAAIDEFEDEINAECVIEYIRDACSSLSNIY